MAENLLHYYDRTDPAKKYKKLMFRSGFVLQSAELNEVQSLFHNQIKGVGDAIFKDGDVIRDAGISINPHTGATKCATGAIYMRGAVHGVVAKDFTIPIDLTVAVGVYYYETVVTELHDPNLRDPSVEVRNYQEPGAGRLKATLTWGWQAAGQSDGQPGEFYPVYLADYGNLRIKVTPPQLDSVSQAIARYDRDATGGDYVVSGLKVTKLPDVNGVQQYSIDSGAARVNGFAVEMGSSRRLPYAAVPDLRFIDSEPYVSTTMAPQRVEFDRFPVADITQVRITGQKSAEIVHGSFLGAQDPLPDSAIVEIVAVNQGGSVNGAGTGFVGGTTYVQGADYKLTGQKIDWSLGGAEVSTGTTYRVIYRHITSITPTAVDATGFTVTGAVVGTLIQTSYNVKLPRIDRLCVTQEGSFQFIKGTSTDFDPVPPPVPHEYLPLAQVYQSWFGPTTLLSNDGLRVVPMKDLEDLNSKVDLVFDLIAQQRLTSDLNSRESAIKKGVFVDPFLNDNQRDAGIAQNAAIVDGELMLPIAATFNRPSSDVSVPQVLGASWAVVLQQGSITGSMLINPYQAFDAIPAQIVLDPPADHFTVTNSNFTSDATRSLLQVVGTRLAPSTTTTSVQTVVLSSSSTAAKFLRQMDINFTISGMDPGESISSITFDGIQIAPVAP